MDQGGSDRLVGGLVAFPFSLVGCTFRLLEVVRGSLDVSTWAFSNTIDLVTRRHESTCRRARCLCLLRMHRTVQHDRVLWLLVPIHETTGPTIIHHDKAQLNGVSFASNRAGGGISDLVDWGQD